MEARPRIVIGRYFSLEEMQQPHWHANTSILERETVVRKMFATIPRSPHKNIFSIEFLTTKTSAGLDNDLAKLKRVAIQLENHAYQKAPSKVLISLLNFR